MMPVLAVFSCVGLCLVMEAVQLTYAIWRGDIDSLIDATASPCA
jgi:hypothetical protein